MGREPVSLQINVSGGDVAYAEQTVPSLVQAHRGEVGEVLLVVDCIRPGRTKIVDPDKKFPREKFDERVVQITKIAEHFLESGLVDRVEFLHSGDEILSYLSAKYLRGLVTETHDFGGCGLASYLAGIELSTSRYVLHYDADMLLHQKQSYSWLDEALSVLKSNAQVLAVTPRIAPPIQEDPNKPSVMDWPPYRPSQDSWRDDWLSTRCFVMCKERLQDLLPLLKGRVLWEVLAVKYFGGGYPRSPEVMISHRMKAENFERAILMSEDAWLLHPVDKSKSFLEALPKILKRVKSGQFPHAQGGFPDLELSHWDAA